MHISNKKFLGSLFFSSIMYVICALSETLFALVLGNIVDNAVNGNMSHLFYNIAISIGIILVSLLIYYVAIDLRRNYVMKNIIQIKNNIMDSIYQKGLIDFRKNSDSYYMNILTNDVDLLENNYFLPKPILIFYISQFVFSITALIYISWKATLAFFLLFLIPLVVPQLFGGVLAKKSKDVSKNNEKFTFELKEQIQGMAEIYENLSISAFMKRFMDTNRSQQMSKRKDGTAKTFVNQISCTCGLISQLGCMAIGGVLVVQKEMSIGALIAAIQLLNAVFQPINGISEILAQSKSVKPIIEKFRKEVATYTISSSSNSLSNKLSGNIQYNNVYAWYDKENPIISDFNFNFVEGKTYAIVGKSGCGKTTLLKCLLKLHENYSGVISIGDKDIRNIAADDIYKYIGYVPQNAYIFNDTLKQNIKMYGEYSDQDVKYIIDKTKLSELDQKCHGSLGDAASLISGGEKQRIALARALIRNPRVLVFDEPTTALDPTTRDSINELIFSLQGYTRIVITHDIRPEYLDRFDDVISM